MSDTNRAQECDNEYRCCWCGEWYARLKTTAAVAITAGVRGAFSGRFLPSPDTVAQPQVADRFERRPSTSLAVGARPVPFGAIDRVLVVVRVPPMNVYFAQAILSAPLPRVCSNRFFVGMCFHSAIVHKLSLVRTQFSLVRAKSCVRDRIQQ